MPSLESRILNQLIRLRTAFLRCLKAKERGEINCQNYSPFGIRLILLEMFAVFRGSKPGKVIPEFWLKQTVSVHLKVNRL